MAKLERIIVSIALLCLSIVIAVPVICCVSFHMPNLSMEPTVKQGAWIVANRFGPANVTRGALVMHYRESESEGRILVLKRIIGLPGETVVIQNGRASILGATWNDNFGHFEDRVDLPTPNFPVRENYQIHLGPDEVFVLGDNRWRSVDSRTYGPVKLSQIQYWDPWIFN